MGWRSAGRTVLRWVFWLFMALIFVRGAVSFFPTAPAAATPKDAVETKPAAEPAGLRSFPAMFAREYLTWSPNRPDERGQRLRPYLARSLDQQVGWNQGKDGVGQRVVETWVHNVRQISATRWLITVAARVAPYQDASSGPVAAPPAAGSATVATTVATTVTTTTPPAAPVLPETTLYLAVPVGTAAGGGWVVYDLPSLVPAPAAAEFTEPAYYGQEFTDKDGRVGILLDGFFRAYFGGGDVTYFLISGVQVSSMKGPWSFQAISKLVLVGDGKEQWALADVQVQDSTTGARFTSRYTLGLTEQEGRWYVKEITQRGE